jgi:hypothetical protein
MVASTNRLVQHIARATTRSPYVSLTRSYPVAWGYAVSAGRVYPSPGNPAYVYEIEIEKPSRHGVQLIDPIKELASELNAPHARNTYQHDGHQDFILGVADPFKMAHCLSRICSQPPGSTGAPRAGNLTMELEMLVRAMRDSEILSVGTIPAGWVRSRFVLEG